MAQTTRQKIHCGRHSNIPKCCILWYISLWRLVFKFDPWHTKRRADDYQGHVSYYEWHWYHNWRPDLQELSNYVQCPLCKLIGRIPNEIRRCCCKRKQAKSLYIKNERKRCQTV